MINKKMLAHLQQQFTKEEVSLLLQLNSPEKIQDFVDTLPSNTEPNGDTVLSPLRVLRENRAHCVEAAMFAAMSMSLHGYEPLLLDLTANKKDQDHVIMIFKKNGHFGAISKTNHYCLGYRDPIYRTIRELVMSYFHEYLNDNGEKTLRSYSKVFNLRRLQTDWISQQDDVWIVPETLVKLPHKKVLTRNQERTLRNADEFTRKLNNKKRT